jgi:hypothetical protein
LEWLAPPAAPPAGPFPTSLLARKPIGVQPPQDEPAFRYPIEWLWPPPPPPAPNPWTLWMRDDRRGVEPVEERAQARAEGARLYDWFPGQPTESLSKVYVGPWSDPVTFGPGDEYRLTIEGPAVDNPKIRVALKLEGEGV